MENGKNPILDNQFLENKGLTKLEYFAGLAMQGLLTQGHWNSYEILSKRSIEIADELLKQLDK